MQMYWHVTRSITPTTRTNCGTEQNQLQMATTTKKRKKIELFDKYGRKQMRLHLFFQIGGWYELKR